MAYLIDPYLAVHTRGHVYYIVGPLPHQISLYLLMYMLELLEGSFCVNWADIHMLVDKTIITGL